MGYIDDKYHNQDANNSVEIERIQNGSYQQSDQSVIRVVDDMNTTFQSEIYRVEGGTANRYSLASGVSDQTST